MVSDLTLALFFTVYHLLHVEQTPVFTMGFIGGEKWKKKQPIRFLFTPRNMKNHVFILLEIEFLLL